MLELGTILTAIVTPFDADLRVDEEAFVALMHHLGEHGSDGFVVCGTTGEASTLTDEEHLGLIELAVKEKPAGKSIVGGTGSNNTLHAAHLTERATEMGVDATLSVTPYYNRPSPLGLKRHYEEVAKATDRPVLLYNIPHRTGTNIPRRCWRSLGRSSTSRGSSRPMRMSCRRSTDSSCLRGTMGRSRARSIWVVRAAFSWQAMWLETRCGGWWTSPSDGMRSMRACATCIRHCS